MVTVKKRVEVFTAGCLVCDGIIDLVKSLICPSCELKLYDLREGCATNECREKAARYGIMALPAVLVNGTPLDCCRRGPIDAAVLRVAGVGQVKKKKGMEERDGPHDCSGQA